MHLIFLLKFVFHQPNKTCFINIDMTIKIKPAGFNG